MRGEGDVFRIAAFLRVPPGVTHDFENRSDHRAGMLNVYIPGGFEKDMPAVVEWFKEHRPHG
jgi:hypothetical protein